MSKNEDNIRYSFVRAFKSVNGISFWGGEVSDCLIAGPFDLIINLSHSDLPTPAVEKVPQGFKNFQSSVMIPSVLRIRCTNDGITNLPPNAWAALAKDLIESTLISDVAVVANTATDEVGMALAILNDLLTKSAVNSDPVEKIRKLYSPQSVHDNTQIEYIEFVTGKKVKVSGSKEKK